MSDDMMRCTKQVLAALDAAIQRHTILRDTSAFFSADQFWLVSFCGETTRRDVTSIKSMY
jgi:hypothetical protein